MGFQNLDYQYSKSKGLLQYFHNAQYMGYENFIKWGADVTWHKPCLNNKITKFLDKILKSANSNSFVLGQLNMIKLCNEHDVIYYPFDGHLIILALLRMLRIIRTPILIMSTSSYTKKDVPRGKQRFLKSLEWRIYKHGIDEIVWQSEQTMKRARSLGCMGLLPPYFVKWGADRTFYLECFKKKSEGKYYVLVGQNERDFNTIIDAFKKMPDVELRILAPIDIITPPNVKIIKKQWDGYQWDYMRNLYADAKASIIALKRSTDIQFGATVLVDSIASATPLLMTEFDNKFIDVKKEGIGIYAKPQDTEDWIRIITTIEKNKGVLDNMSEKLKHISLEYNYENFSKDIYNRLIHLVKSK